MRTRGLARAGVQADIGCQRIGVGAIAAGSAGDLTRSFYMNIEVIAFGPPFACHVHRVNVVVGAKIRVRAHPLVGDYFCNGFGYAGGKRRDNDIEALIERVPDGRFLAALERGLRAA